MAIISAGYDGTVDEQQWARLVSMAGASEYGVDRMADFAVAAVAGQDRTVSIAPGSAWGFGVLDVMDTNETAQLASVSSGSRWDMIVLRRDWQPPGGNTSIAVVTGGLTQALPDRNRAPGVIDDQPIALVQVKAGSSAIQSITDLRAWARNGGMTARHDLARSYLGNIGAQIEVAGTLWQRRIGSNSVAEWVALAKLDDTGWLSTGLSIPTANVSWRLDGYRVRRKNGELWAFLNFTFTHTSVIAANVGGNIADTKVATLPAGYRPSSLSPWPVTINKPGTQEWFGRLEGDGSLVITHGMPNATIRLGDALRIVVHCPLD